MWWRGWFLGSGFDVVGGAVIVTVIVIVIVVWTV